MNKNNCLNLFTVVTLFHPGRKRKIIRMRNLKTKMPSFDCFNFSQNGNFIVQIETIPILQWSKSIPTLILAKLQTISVKIKKTSL